MASTEKQILKLQQEKDKLVAEYKVKIRALQEKLKKGNK